MIAAKKIVSAFRSLRLGNKLSLMAATVSVFGVLGAVSVTGSASAQSNNGGPAVRSDCRDWRSYPQNFDNRAACNDFVDALNANSNGYGGGGNGGNGGGLGGFIGRLFSFLSNLFQVIASFFNRLF